MNLVSAPEPIVVLALNIHSNLLCNLPANRVMEWIETHGILEPPLNRIKTRYTSRVSSYSPNSQIQTFS